MLDAVCSKFKHLNPRLIDKRLGTKFLYGLNIPTFYVRFTETSGGNGTIDCTQVTISVTSQLNGTDVSTSLAGNNGQSNNVSTPTLSPSNSNQPVPSITSTVAMSPVPSGNATNGGNTTVTVTLPLQPVDRCNPAGNATQSSKRLGFTGVRISSSLSTEPHQPMDDAPVRTFLAPF